MDFSKYVSAVQNFTKVSKPELIAAIVVLLGAAFAPLKNYFQADESKLPYTPERFYAILDSLAELERSSYIGSDPSGKPDSLLALADTLTEKDNLFPKSMKKDLPKDLKISLNSSSKAELMRIPNVGAATANKIIEYRDAHKFKSIDEIKNIKGIGEKKFDKMKANLKL
jgi:competence ComEA-like helix-hairpin-helix protein